MIAPHTLYIILTFSGTTMLTSAAYLTRVFWRGLLASQYDFIQLNPIGGARKFRRYFLFHLLTLPVSFSAFITTLLITIV